MSGRSAVIDCGQQMTVRQLRVAAQRALQVRLAALLLEGRVVPEGQRVAALETHSLQAVARGPCLVSSCYSRAFAHVDAKGRLRAWGSAAYGGRVEELQEVEEVQHAAAFFEAGAFAAIRSDGSMAD